MKGTRTEFAFQVSTSSLRFGAGVTAEIGMDFREMGASSVLVVTDKKVAGLRPVETVRGSLEREGIRYDLFDEVRIEPNDRSFQAAIEVASEGEYDGFAAVGGGSTIDTAKAANLYSTFPDEFLAYVNAPLGEGKPIPGPLKPLIAVPTTSGTGSEATGVSIFDLSEKRAKTGIAHRRLKPALGLVDPENILSSPRAVIASTGLDVLCHALESYTALPFTERPYHESPLLRPAYQGSNPVSDIWAIESIRMVSRYLRRLYENPADEEARTQMVMAASYAGLGFGNAGVHLCHGMSYPVSSMVRDYYPDGYPKNHPMVPHGVSVALTAPAVFRFTASANPSRHLFAAAALGLDVTEASFDDAGEILVEGLVALMRTLGVPNGLVALGFNEDDIPQLVAGTLPQHRVTKLSPRSASGEDLTQLFRDSMRIW